MNNFYFILFIHKMIFGNNKKVKIAEYLSFLLYNALFLMTLRFESATESNPTPLPTVLLILLTSAVTKALIGWETCTCLVAINKVNEPHPTPIYPGSIGTRTEEEGSTLPMTTLESVRGHPPLLSPPRASTY